MMKKTILSISLIIMTLSSFLLAQSNTLSGVSIPKHYIYNGKKLILNGSAIREKYFMDIYVGSLYLQSKSNNATQIINSNEDMAFRMKIVTNMLTAKIMRTNIEKSFSKVANQYPVDKKVLNSILDIVVQRKINKGDEFYFVYNKETGISIIKDGVVLGSLKDFALKKALYATWLANAISKDFTSHVLNGN